MLKAGKMELGDYAQLMEEFKSWLDARGYNFRSTLAAFALRTMGKSRPPPAPAEMPPPKRPRRGKPPTPVAISRNGRLLHFPSQSDAARHIGVHASRVTCAMLRGKRVAGWKVVRT